MAVIQREVSVAANTTVENLLAGSAFEFARGPQLVSLGVTAAATGVFITFTSGADVVLEESAAPIKTAYPTIPDEFFYTDVAAPGDRYVLRVRNTTGGTIIVRAIMQIQDIR
jgi:hypothetical protein